MPIHNTNPLLLDIQLDAKLKICQKMVTLKSGNETLRLMNGRTDERTNKQTLICIIPSVLHILYFLSGCIVKPQISHFANFHTVKNWYQFFTAREKLVPILHIFHTNISHFVKFAPVVKLYVAYTRNLHIDKKSPKSAASCIRFQFFTYMSGFYNVVQTGYR